MIIVFTIIGVAMVIIGEFLERFFFPPLPYLCQTGCIFIGFTFSVNESKTYRYDNLCPLRVSNHHFDYARLRC